MATTERKVEALEEMVRQLSIQLQEVKNKNVANSEVQAVQELATEIQRVSNEQVAMRQHLDTADSGLVKIINKGLSVMEGKKKQKEIAESKAVDRLEVFKGGERHAYKEWHEKFVNVFSQVRTGTRSLLEELQKAGDYRDEHWGT